MEPFFCAPSNLLKESPVARSTHIFIGSATSTLMTNRKLISIGVYPPFTPQFPHNHANFPTHIILLPSTVPFSHNLPCQRSFPDHLSFFKPRLYNYQLWPRHRARLQPLRSATLSSVLISRKLCVLILTITKCLLSTC